MRNPAPIALLAGLLAGCAAQAVKIPPAPTIVRVPVDRYVPVPAELTARMDPRRPAAQDYQEAKALALRRLEVIMAGNCRFLRIASLAQPLSPAERGEWQTNECGTEAEPERVKAADTGSAKP